ncbi:MAG: peptidylprolyl isomerase [Betaproteobacteria bacterium]|nr:peptidylprolyl isomerase [Betaproteobacteria bacterium]
MQIKKLVVATACIAGLTALTGCNAAEDNKPASAAAPAQPAGKIMAVVNGVPIPQEELNVLEQDRSAQGQPINDQAIAAMRDSLINGEILAQQAQKKGIDKTSNFQMHLQLAKTQMLAQAFIADYVRANPVSEDAMKAEYNRVKAMMGTKEYEVSHILVDNEAEARSIIAQLNKKAKFSELAKKDSKDASASNGGQLGWIAPANLVKEFADAMVQLKKGEYTREPVHTKYGWHIIKVDDIRDLKFPAYDQVKNQLRTDLEQQEIRKLISDLRASAKIE